MTIDLSFTKLVEIAPDRTLRLEMPDLTPAGAPLVVFVLKHAGDGNRAYKNALAKSKKRIDPTTESGRDAEAHLLAEHCFAGWEGVRNLDGTPAECTPANVYELLAGILATPGALSTWYAIDNTASNSANFRADVADASNLGKR